MGDEENENKHKEFVEAYKNSIEVYSHSNDWQSYIKPKNIAGNIIDNKKLTFPMPSWEYEYPIADLGEQDSELTDFIRRYWEGKKVAEIEVKPKVDTELEEFEKRIKETGW